MSDITGQKQDTKFKPGVSGNPAGRPPGSFSLVEILKKKLAEMPDGNKTNAELLIEKMIDMSLKRGNDQQIKNILQYVEGMPKQPTELSGDVNIVFDWKKDATSNDTLQSSTSSETVAQ